MSSRNLNLNNLYLLSNEEIENIIAKLEVELRERHLGSNPDALRNDNSFHDL